MSVKGVSWEYEGGESYKVSQVYLVGNETTNNGFMLFTTFQTGRITVI